MSIRNKPQTAPCQSINANGKLLSFDEPLLMGILNVTPDSFFDGGMHNTTHSALRKAKELLHDGADIIDLGAYSSRPGAAPITTQQELDRAIPVIEALVNEVPDALISIDTFRSEVARAAIGAGAHLINDISGGTLDENMFSTVAELQVPYILMHMRGTPETMATLTDYTDIVQDIALYFGEKIAYLRKLGVKDIILDPGFGFAKTIEQNYELLYRIAELQYFDLPILGGISRKSMIYKKLGITAQEALNGTTVLHTLLLDRGVQLLRVHDVKEAKQLLQLIR
ncbi:dihydropteroate synthase [Sphingobacterium sp. Mn56C]|uniref:dihydropteroate synthase n=1 Tax=Sphingobacterium sp. Mn56C TaxID=3395261 RepID=UPI003BE3C29E